MSYLFQSRQLHPRLCSPGMGSIGPEQAWTPETASKPLVRATRSCLRRQVLRKVSEYTTPKRQVGGEIVDDPTCSRNGAIWEASRPGAPRQIGWCCDKQKTLSPRALTQEEHVTYGMLCNPVQDESGIIYETLPEWRDPNQYVEPPCVKANAVDDGYELICCPVPGSMTTLTMADVTFVQGAPSAEQSAEQEAMRQQRALEEEQARQAAALPLATVLDRYGFPLALTAGVVIFGGAAALFSRIAAQKKVEKAKKSKKRPAKRSKATRRQKKGK